MPPKRSTDSSSNNVVENVENELNFVELIALTDGNKNLVFGTGTNPLGRGDLANEDKGVSRNHCNINVKVCIFQLH
jgi:hypothetical protein